MTGTARNIRLYPAYRFLTNLLFWQSVWFLYLQEQLSAAEAVLMYVIFDLSTTVLEVPSGWLSDRWGRRPTLVLAAFAGLATATMQALGGDFLWFAIAQVLLGIHMAFASGTDSSLLYQSLVAEGRGDEVERHEVRAWRASFLALAVSAVTGGALARWDLTWAYVASAVAFAGLIGICFALAEPPRSSAPTGAKARLSHLRTALLHPVLAWLFALTVLMYAFSHVPFVFGQPFIQQALQSSGLSDEVPLVSGIVTASMMCVSLMVSVVAPRLRRATGLTLLLLMAFALQIALPGVLAWAMGPLAILFLLSRMVPDALARPFVVARIQPMLQDDSRATYLSLQSLCGRLLLAASLAVAASQTSDVGLMAEADLRGVLWAYAMVGAGCLLVLAVFGFILRARLDDGTLKDRSTQRT